LEVRRILTKRNLMMQLEGKFQNMESNIQKFNRKFNVLNHKGLRGLMGIGYKLISLENYHEKLYTIEMDNQCFLPSKEASKEKPSWNIWTLIC